MVFEIETLTDGTPYYEQITALDGRDFKLIFSFNPRDDHWYLTIRTEEDERIKGCEGLKLAMNSWPIRKVTDLLRPPGEFFVSGDAEKHPGIFDLGAGSVLVYITEPEMEQIRQ